MYVRGVNSTVTKYSDYFVWKDTSERVARRCDDTVDKKRVNSCVLKHLCWREFSNQKNCHKTPELLSPTGYWCRISRLTPQKKKRHELFCWLKKEDAKTGHHAASDGRVPRRDAMGQKRQWPWSTGGSRCPLAHTGTCGPMAHRYTPIIYTNIYDTHSSACAYMYIKHTHNVSKYIHQRHTSWCAHV